MALKLPGGNSAYHNFNNDYLYVVDPAERRRLALSEIDTASFGWYHIRTVVVTGIGFFTDAYDIFAISLVSSMIGVVYFGHNLPPSAETSIKVASSVGNVLGQSVFGWLADMIGRKRMYGVELMIMIASTVAQALTAASPAMSIVGLLVFWRIIMGIGIGGDYPLSAVITSEFAPSKYRGGMVGAVFAMQGLGQFGAAIVSLIAVAAFRDQLINVPDLPSCHGSCLTAVDRLWRVVIGFGAIPGLFALYYRLTIPETPRYTFEVRRDAVQASSDIKAFLTGRSRGRADEVERARNRRPSRTWDTPEASWKDFWRYMLAWKNGKVLLGTAGSWFFLDVAFYGVTLNSTMFLSEIGFASGPNLHDYFFNTSVGQLIIVCAGAIPGYWFTVVFVDSLGRKPIQYMGFIMTLAMLCIMGFGYDRIGHAGLMTCFVIAQFFFNFGPNATTFIIPGECFPTRYRSTSHGISAAAGKIGALIAQCAIGPLRSKGATPDNPAPFLPHVLQIFALFMLCGIFTTALVPETKRRTLEDISDENPAVDTSDTTSARTVQSDVQRLIRLQTRPLESITESPTEIYTRSPSYYRERWD